MGEPKLRLGLNGVEMMMMNGVEVHGENDSSSKDCMNYSEG